MPDKRYDEKCFQLSTYFLPDAEISEQEDLTEAIQEAVEDYLSFRARGEGDAG